MQVNPLISSSFITVITQCIILVYNLLNVFIHFILLLPLEALVTVNCRHRSSQISFQKNQFQEILQVRYYISIFYQLEHFFLNKIFRFMFHEVVKVW